MATSQKQTSLFIEEKSTSLPEGFLASHLAQQVSEKGKKMLAISGQKCLEQFEKHSRATLWGKMFMELLIKEGGLVFEQVCVDLENEGFQIQPNLTAKNIFHGTE